MVGGTDDDDAGSILDTCEQLKEQVDDLRPIFDVFAAEWGVRDEDAQLLLGGVSDRQFRLMKKDPQRTLDVDTLTRISYLVGIFKSLGDLYSEQLADAWVQRPNANTLFGGQTTLAYMFKGGVFAMHIVRQLVDARRIEG
jgi:hypothetical protein